MSGEIPLLDAQYATSFINIQSAEPQETPTSNVRVSLLTSSYDGDEKTDGEDSLSSYTKPTKPYGRKSASDAIIPPVTTAPSRSIPLDEDDEVNKEEMIRKDITARKICSFAYDQSKTSASIEGGGNLCLTPGNCNVYYINF